MARTVGIGYQDFAQLITNEIFYVDKTAFIKEWWENKDMVTLITRPRRFGKTLNLSMLEQFFSVEHAGRGDLFEGLAIWEEEVYKGEQGVHFLGTEQSDGGDSNVGAVCRRLWIYGERSPYGTERIWNGRQNACSVVGGKRNPKGTDPVLWTGF